MLQLLSKSFSHNNRDIKGLKTVLFIIDKNSSINEHITGVGQADKRRFYYFNSMENEK
jgi:hypothetical protein